ITGKAAHAGVHPEQGISATVVTSLALAEVYKGGWFGKIKRKDGEGTSNVGSIGDRTGRSAGEATNVVTDFALVRGGSRSHDSTFVKKITNAYRDAFRAAARKVTDDRGRKAKVKFTARRDYYPFRIKPTTAVVRNAEAVAKGLGYTPNLRISNGGLDANWMVRHGIPTITFGAGQNNIHQVGEYVELADFERGCQFALALAVS